MTIITIALKLSLIISFFLVVILKNILSDETMELDTESTLDSEQLFLNRLPSN